MTDFAEKETTVSSANKVVINFLGLGFRFRV